MPRLTKIVLALGILAAPAVAFAHPHGDGAADAAPIEAKRAARLEAKLDKLFAKLDVDKNGAISRAELGAMKSKKMLRGKLLKMKRAKHARHARMMRGHHRR
jgi:hypothetical protein